MGDSLNEKQFSLVGILSYIGETQTKVALLEPDDGNNMTDILSLLTGEK
jgi:hypothetical protein